MLRDWRSPPDPTIEPLKVLIRRDQFVDDARGGRVVPFKIYYPETKDGPLPLIVWSHGLGGSRDGASFLARFIASHGYVVVHVQHVGTDSSLWEGKPGHPWDVIRAAQISRAVTLDRFRDVPFLLDQLPDWVARNGADMPDIDWSRIGMSGHSFGALTSQVIAGQLYPDENNVQQSFRDDRFKAGILYSPVPTKGADTVRIYGGINLPLFHMTGTTDDSPVEHYGYEKRLAVYEATAIPGQALLVLEEGDHMVFTGSRGQLGDNPKRGLQETIIKIAALAFWDASLHDDAAASSWLRDGGFENWLGAEGRISVLPASGASAAAR